MRRTLPRYDTGHCPEDDPGGVDARAVAAFLLPMPSFAPSPRWHPERLAARLPFLHRRARLLADIRAFLGARGYMEVETPVLQPCPGMEPNLEPFATRYGAKLGEDERAMYLQFSPEFAMKKLLAGGAGPIFQFARVFRNGEAGPNHQPEFTMLEWYRPGLGLDGLMDETEALVRAAVPEGLRTPTITVPTEVPFARLTVAEAFQRHCGGLDILATAPDPLAPDVALLAAAAAPLGVAHRAGETWQDLFFRLLLDRIEPAIGRERPTFLTHWPASEAALSRRDAHDPRVALRFELFAGGLELANAYEELTDAAEQRARFAAWAEERLRVAGEVRAVDEAFLAALDHGLPDCSGIAMGVDRLAMLAAGAGRIEDVLWLPVV
jgi:lysyl-tRNA synthetase class 2